MKQNLIETFVGLAVLVITIIFLVFAYKTGNSKSNTKGYTLLATFQNIEGIMVGSDVMIAGIKVGSVKKITLNQNDFFATISLNIDNAVKIPKDSKASVVTSGLLGGKYILITPGIEGDNLVSNDQIIYTQSTINIESLISKIIAAFAAQKGGS